MSGSRTDPAAAGSQTERPGGGGVPVTDGRDDADALAAELAEIRSALPSRVEVGEEDPESGLVRLVLTLVEFLREVLEHQAVRRMEAGTLTDEEVERLGRALMRLADRMEELKETFGLDDEDLQLDLGPLGRLR